MLRAHTPHLPSPMPPAHVRDELVRVGIPLVRRTAFRLARRLPPSVAVDDLIGAGTEGLLRAIDHYDPIKHPSFAAYASFRIRGAILDELRANDPMTRHGRRKLSEVTRAVKELERTLGRAPDEAEIANALGIPLESYQKLAEGFAHGPALSRNDIDPDDVAGASNNPFDALDDADLKKRLAGAIRNLPERTQTVLGLYYQQECTQAEIGKILGITESRVCQILGDATARLRAALEGA